MINPHGKDSLRLRNQIKKWINNFKLLP